MPNGRPARTVEPLPTVSARLGKVDQPPAHARASAVVGRGRGNLDRDLTSIRHQHSGTNPGGHPSIYERYGSLWRAVNSSQRRPKDAQGTRSGRRGPTPFTTPFTPPGLAPQQHKPSCVGQHRTQFLHAHQPWASTFQIHPRHHGCSVHDSQFTVVADSRIPVHSSRSLPIHDSRITVHHSRPFPVPVAPLPAVLHSSAVVSG